MTDTSRAAGGEASSPTVSVVIPAYNAAGFIGRAIGSVQKQTLQDFEIIVVDDVSTDETKDVVRALAEVDARIVLIESARNGGPSVARNAGFAASRGAWIAVLDADDAFDPNRLERLVTLAERHGLDMLADDICYYDVVAATKVGAAGFATGGELVPVDLDAYLRSCTFLPGPAEILFKEAKQYSLLKFIFRAEFVREHGISYPVQYRYGEDFLIYFDALKAGAKAALHGEALYIYSQQFGSISLSRSAQSRTVPNRSAVVGAIDDILTRHSDLSDRQRSYLSTRKRATVALQQYEAVRSRVKAGDLAAGGRALASNPVLLRFAAQDLRRSLVARAQRMLRAAGARRG